MEVYVVGDIHGYSKVCEKALAYLRLKLGSDPNSIAIFVGDYIDRGPDPFGVIEKLDAFRTKYNRISERVFFLIGNHEYIMLKYLFGAYTYKEQQKQYSRFASDALGGGATIEAAGGEEQLKAKFLKYKVFLNNLYGEIVINNLGGKSFRITHGGPFHPNDLIDKNEEKIMQQKRIMGRFFHDRNPLRNVYAWDDQFRAFLGNLFASKQYIEVFGHSSIVPTGEWEHAIPGVQLSSQVNTANKIVQNIKKLYDSVRIVPVDVGVHGDGLNRKLLVANLCDNSFEIFCAQQEFGIRRNSAPVVSHVQQSSLPGAATSFMPATAKAARPGLPPRPSQGRSRRVPVQPGMPHQPQVSRGAGTFPDSRHRRFSTVMPDSIKDADLMLRSDKTINALAFSPFSSLADLPRVAVEEDDRLFRALDAWGKKEVSDSQPIKRPGPCNMFSCCFPQ